MGTENPFSEVEDYAFTLIKHKARQLVGRTGFTESDRPDLEQELMLDVLQRLPNYDATRSKLTTFVARIVEHRLATILDARFRECRDPRRLAGSLNQRVDGGEGERVQRVETIDQERYWSRRGCGGGRPESELRDLAAELRPVLDELPDDLRELALWLSSTTNVTEISRETGWCRSVIYKRINRLRARLVEARLRDYL